MLLAAQIQKSVMLPWLWRQMDDYQEPRVNGNQFQHSNCCFTLKIVYALHCRDRGHGAQDVEGFHSRHPAASGLSTTTRQTWARGLVGERRWAGAHRGQSVPGWPGSGLQSHRGGRFRHLHLRGPEQGRTQDTGVHLHCGQWVMLRLIKRDIWLVSVFLKFTHTRDVKSLILLQFWRGVLMIQSLID